MVGPKGKILLVIIQSQDIDIAEDALKELEVVYYRLPSVGGFLGRRNATLVLKTSENQIDDAIEALNKTCRQRVEYIAVPLESAPLPLPTPTPISVGGATVFCLDVENIEEL